ncbi:hypothetical protein V8E54_008738 [Elaphomyces granulatus]|jgi:hypothetical protein
MPVSLYEISVPIFIRGLNALSHILAEAEKYAKEKDIPISEFIEARLYPDMLPLTFQIQACSDVSKSAIVRVAGTEPVVMEDNESTIEQLQARIARTIDILKNVKPEDLEGKEDKEVIVKSKTVELKYTGRNYFQHHSLPNFLFHVTTAYAILRSKGVPLGKRDYLKSFYPGIPIDV